MYGVYGTYNKGFFFFFKLMLKVMGMWRDRVQQIWQHVSTYSQLVTV